MSALLDVNALAAIVWPNHMHHAAIRTWFGAHAAAGWATCSVTQSGFVRVASNPATPFARSPAEAVLALTRLCATPGHELWADDVAWSSQDEVAPRHLQGHRQVTDTHLLILSVRRGGRLVTFDRGIHELAARVGHADAVELVSS